MCVDVCMLPKKAGICTFSCFPLFLTKIAYNLYSVPVFFLNLISYPGSHSIPVHRSLPYSFLQSSQQCFVKLLNFCQFVGARGGINRVSVVLICKSTMSEMEYLLICLQTLKIFAVNCLYMCFCPSQCLSFFYVRILPLYLWCMWKYFCPISHVSFQSEVKYR